MWVADLFRVGFVQSNIVSKWAHQLPCILHCSQGGLAFAAPLRDTVHTAVQSTGNLFRVHESAAPVPSLWSRRALKVDLILVWELLESIPKIKIKKNKAKTVLGAVFRTFNALVGEPCPTMSRAFIGQGERVQHGRGDLFRCEQTVVIKGSARTPPPHLSAETTFHGTHVFMAETWMTFPALCWTPARIRVAGKRGSV